MQNASDFQQTRRHVVVNEVEGMMMSIHCASALLRDHLGRIPRHWGVANNHPPPDRNP